MSVHLFTRVTDINLTYDGELEITHHGEWKSFKPGEWIGFHVSKPNAYRQVEVRCCA